MPTDPQTSASPRSSLGGGADDRTKSRFSLAIFFLVIALIGVLGGLSWWAHLGEEATPTSTPLAERPTAQENNEPESTTAKAQVESMQAVSPSDSMGAIEADIENTQLKSLGSELEAIEAELEAALEDF